MINLKTILLLVLLSLFLFSTNTYAQTRNYMYGGIEMNVFSELEPLELLLYDYNTFHRNTDITTLQLFSTPEYIQGFMIGTKIHSRFNVVGGNVHFNQFVTFAEGQNESGGDYYEKLVLSNNGFLIHYNFMWINTNHFRSGPGIGGKIEQFRIKTDFEHGSNLTTRYPINKALISGQINYTISIGGPKFNIDFIGFYNIPFSLVDLCPLDEIINEDSPHGITEMQLSATTYGVALRIGLGSRDNYDY